MTGPDPGSLAERVAAFSSAQRELLADALAREPVQRGAEQLVGFLVLTTPGAVSEDALRHFLAERLPDHMIPSRFAMVDHLPRLGSGKLDRQALRSLSGAGGSAGRDRPDAGGPRTDVEGRLTAIWREVLRQDVIGLDDDFFEIGGDSLLSIRIIARAGREGIRIVPEAFFAKPTIRHLAASVSPPDSDAPGVPTGRIGEAPLTPIQHWFLERIPVHRDQWNQAHLLDLGHPLDSGTVEAIVRLLVEHHDALRLRLSRRPGGWVQEFPPAGDDSPYRAVHLDGIPMAEYGARIREECAREQATIRIEEGRLFRCVDFLGEDGWRRLLLLGHHLVLDGVSWHVLLDDLAVLVTQAASGASLRLPSQTASARAWALGLAERSAAPDIASAAGFWVDQPLGGDDAMPFAAGTIREAATVTLELDPQVSQLLLRDTPQRLGVQVPALLLSALLLAWRDWSEGADLHLDLEGHGRDILGAGFDLSRTVGWFTTVFPVRLAAPPDAGAGADASTVIAAVQSVLDALPLRGAAHGMAVHLAPAAPFQAALAAQSRPRILFNHLGTFDLALPSASRLAPSPEPIGALRHPDSERAYEIEINSRVESGRLLVAIEYPGRKYSPAAMGRFVEGLGRSLARVGQPPPARFGLAGVDSATLDTVAALLRELEQS